MSEVLFRSMKQADDGTPVEERSARGLGVRIGELEEEQEDIPLMDGQVRPGTGGMSVALDSFLTPLREMPIEDYEALLGQTKHAWRRII
jgi:hypothetical protein